jgi:alkylation response protein AidB-like acyl-CoA dehydrogenase
MKFDLTDDQEAFLGTAKRFLADHAPLSDVRALWPSREGYSADYWKVAAELGWTAAFVPEPLGGGSVSGRPAEDAALVAEAMGDQVSPGPFLPANVVAAGVAHNGSAGDHATVLSGIAAGEVTPTWALAERGGLWAGILPEIATQVERGRDHLSLRGVKTYVEAAGTADCFLVAARCDAGLTQVLVPVDTPGVRIESGRSLDITRRFGTVTFEAELPLAAIVGSWGEAAATIEHQLCIAVVLQCAESVGAADHVLHTTLAYGQDRYAFGRPITSFQALKHRIADMLQWLEFSKAATSALARALDSTGPDDPSVLASVAKAYVADHCLDIIDECVQLIGGIGVTWEHEIHLYSRRVAVNRALYGTPEQHRERLCLLLGI